MQPNITTLPSIADLLINVYKKRIANIQTTKYAEVKKAYAEIEKEKTEILKDIFNMVESFDKEAIKSFYRQFINDPDIDKVTRVCFHIKTLKDLSTLEDYFSKVLNKYSSFNKKRIYREFINNSNTPLRILQEIFEYALDEITLMCRQEGAEFYIDLMKNHNTDLDLLKKIFSKSRSIFIDMIFTPDYGLDPDKGGLYKPGHKDFYKELINHPLADLNLLKDIFKKVSIINLHSKDKAELYEALINHPLADPELWTSILNDAEITAAERTKINRAAQAEIIAATTAKNKAEEQYKIIVHEQDKIIADAGAKINKATVLKPEHKKTFCAGLENNKHLPHTIQEHIRKFKKNNPKYFKQDLSKKNNPKHLKQDISSLENEFRLENTLILQQLPQVQQHQSYAGRLSREKYEESKHNGKGKGK